MKKRLISLGVAVLLLAMIVAPLGTASALTWGGYVNTSNGKGLYLRSDPSTNGSIILTIPFGAWVGFTEIYNDTWIRVGYAGHEGFVMRRYLSAEAPAPRPVPVPTPAPAPAPQPSGNEIAQIFSGFQITNYYVAVRPSSPGGFVHMRWAPTKSAPILKDFHQNDQLEVLSQNRTWAQVRDPQTGVTGFMMRSFLTDVGVGSSQIGSGAR